MRGGPAIPVPSPGRAKSPAGHPIHRTSPLVLRHKKIAWKRSPWSVTIPVARRIVPLSFFHSPPPTTMSQHCNKKNTLFFPRSYIVSSKTMIYTAFRKANQKLLWRKPFCPPLELIHFHEKYYSACIPARKGMSMRPGSDFTKKQRVKTFSYYIFPGFYAKFYKRRSAQGRCVACDEGMVQIISENPEQDRSEGVSISLAEIP